MTWWDLSETDEFDGVDRVLDAVVRRSRELSIPLMVVGAAARDLLITGVAGVVPLRGTRDVDVAVAVESWEQLDCLTARLTPGPDVPHRYLVGGVEVDIVPFGAVERSDRTITWSNDHTMTVLGFAEALDGADTVRLERCGDVAVPALEAQAALKLVAWRDRHVIDPRDAPDVRELLVASSHGPYVDALYEDDASELEVHGWDPRTAAAARLGRTGAAILGPSVHAEILSIVDGALTGSSLLLDQMGRDLAGNRALLEAYRAGFVSGAPA